MRNLKKILALVLALVMSLSLMATAGAASFPDVDAENPYATAIDVLDGLKVFQGFEDGTFKPTDTLNRAQAAVLVYRIATGDVEGKQVENYSYMAQSKFVDLDGYNWAKGYINYCQNAEIVIGTDATHFAPGAKVTGYQLLVMLLRTLGYGKEQEFSDPKGWELQTAAIAKREGILKNITDGNLGEAAPRQLVAEILFQGLLTPTVEHSYTVAGGYAKGETLGKKNLGLEEVTGIVTGNEYADLYNTSTLPGGKTDLLVGDKEYRLNVTTDLTDIGESRTAYVKKGTQNTFNLVVNELFGNDGNVVAESGDATKVSTLAGSKDLVTDDSTEYFINFSEAYRWSSDYKLKYVLKFAEEEDAQAAADEINNGANYAEYLDEAKAKKNPKFVEVTQEGTSYVVERVIPRTETIFWFDYENMEMIFGKADKTDDDDAKSFVTGQIYVGTQSTKDISDDPDYSWTIFVDKFLAYEDNVRNFSSTTDGEWLKVIDNDGDGIAEYVFDTWYALAEITGYNSRNEYYTYSASGITADAKDGNVNYLGDYEPAVGDMVLAAPIDGKWQIELAPMETKTIKTVSYRDKTVTTTEDDTWNASGDGIGNWTDFADDILAMAEKTSYEIFFDHFGHIRAYRAVNAKASYALLSELYYTNVQNGKVLKNNTPIVEITIGSEEGETETNELYVANPSTKSWANPFEGVARRTGLVGVNTVYDYLTRAVNHLGVLNSGKDPAEYDSNDDTIILEKDQFLYPDGHKVTETNVAAYTLDDDGESVTVNSATAFKYDRQGRQLFYSNLDKDGMPVAFASQYKVTEDEFAARYDLYKKNIADGVMMPAVPADSVVAATKADALTAIKARPVYDVDYVKLDISEGVASKAVRYNTDEADVSYDLYGMVDDANYDGNYVNATHNTEYYVVNLGTSRTGYTVVEGIEYFTDYANVPKIEAKDMKAMYAVAHNTSADKDSCDYWVADVIVIETTGVYQPYDSVALGYYNYSKTTGDVKHLDALDNMTEDPKVQLTPKDLSWANQWKGYGFYEVYDETVSEPDIAAGSIVKIPTEAATDKGETDYNAHGIKAATVARDVEVRQMGDYLMVDYGRRDGSMKNNEVKLAAKDVPVYGICTYDEDGKGNTTSLYPEYEAVELSEYETLFAGDQIIIVYDKGVNNIKYIVVASYDNHIDAADKKDGLVQANWVVKEWRDIIDEQNPGDTRDEVILNFNLTGTETATVICEGTTYTATVAEPNMRIRVSDVNKFDFTLKLANLAALVPAGNYKFIVANTTTAGTYNVTAYESTQVQIKSTTVEIGTAYTVAAVVEIAERAALPIGADDTDIAITAATATRLANELIAIKTNLVTGADSIEVDEDGTTLKTAIVTGIVEAKVNVAVDEAEVELSEEAIAEIKEDLVQSVAEAEDGETLDETIGAIDEVIEDAVGEAAAPLEARKALDDAIAVAKETTYVAATETAAASGYKAAEIAALTGSDAEAAATANSTLTTAITAAEAVDSTETTELAAAKTTLDTAVADYKAAIDTLLGKVDALKTLDDYEKDEILKLSPTNRNTLSTARETAKGEVNSAQSADDAAAKAKTYTDKVDAMLEFLTGDVVTVRAARLWDATTPDDGGMSRLYDSYTITTERNADVYDVALTATGLKKHMCGPKENAEGWWIGYAWALEKDAADLKSIYVGWWPGANPDSPATNQKLGSMLVEDTETGIGEQTYGYATYFQSGNSGNFTNLQKDVIIVWTYKDVDIEVVYHTTTKVAAVASAG